jgi:hypothetical protein
LLPFVAGKFQAATRASDAQAVASAACR